MLETQENEFSDCLLPKRRLKSKAHNLATFYDLCSNTNSNVSPRTARCRKRQDFAQNTELIRRLRIQGLQNEIHDRNDQSTYVKHENYLGKSLKDRLEMENNNLNCNHENELANVEEDLSKKAYRIRNVRNKKLAKQSTKMKKYNYNENIFKQPVHDYSNAYPAIPSQITVIEDYNDSSKRKPRHKTRYKDVEKLNCVDECLRPKNVKARVNSGTFYFPSLDEVKLNEKFDEGLSEYSSSEDLNSKNKGTYYSKKNRSSLFEADSKHVAANISSAKNQCSKLKKSIPRNMQESISILSMEMIKFAKELSLTSERNCKAPNIKQEFNKKKESLNEFSALLSRPRNRLQNKNKHFSSKHDNLMKNTITAQDTSSAEMSQTNIFEIKLQHIKDHLEEINNTSSEQLNSFLEQNKFNPNQKYFDDTNYEFNRFNSPNKLRDDNQIIQEEDSEFEIMEESPLIKNIQTQSADKNKANQDNPQYEIMEDSLIIKNIPSPRDRRHRNKKKVFQKDNPEYKIMKESRIIKNIQTSRDEKNKIIENNPKCEIMKESRITKNSPASKQKNRDKNKFFEEDDPEYNVLKESPIIKNIQTSGNKKNKIIQDNPEFEIMLESRIIKNSPASRERYRYKNKIFEEDNQECEIKKESQIITNSPASRHRYRYKNKSFEKDNQEYKIMEETRIGKACKKKSNKTIPDFDKKFLTAKRKEATCLETHKTEDGFNVLYGQKHSDKNKHLKNIIENGNEEKIHCDNFHRFGEEVCNETFDIPLVENYLKSEKSFQNLHSSTYFSDGSSEIETVLMGDKTLSNYKSPVCKKFMENLVKETVSNNNKLSFQQSIFKNMQLLKDPINIVEDGLFKDSFLCRKDDGEIHSEQVQAENNNPVSNDNFVHNRTIVTQNNNTLSQQQSVDPRNRYASFESEESLSMLSDSAQYSPKSIRSEYSVPRSFTMTPESIISDVLQTQITSSSSTQNEINDSLEDYTNKSPIDIITTNDEIKDKEFVDKVEQWDDGFQRQENEVLKYSTGSVSDSKEKLKLFNLGSAMASTLYGSPIKQPQNKSEKEQLLTNPEKLFGDRRRKWVKQNDTSLNENPWHQNRQNSNENSRHFSLKERMENLLNEEYQPPFYKSDVSNNSNIKEHSSSTTLEIAENLRKLLGIDVSLFENPAHTNVAPQQQHYYPVCFNLSPNVLPNVYLQPVNTLTLNNGVTHTLNKQESNFQTSTDIFQNLVSSDYQAQCSEVSTQTTNNGSNTVQMPEVNEKEVNCVVNRADHMSDLSCKSIEQLEKNLVTNHASKLSSNVHNSSNFVSHSTITSPKNIHVNTDNDIKDNLHDKNKSDLSLKLTDLSKNIKEKSTSGSDMASVLYGPTWEDRVARNSKTVLKQEWIDSNILVNEFKDGQRHYLNYNTTRSSPVRNQNSDYKTEAPRKPKGIVPGLRLDDDDVN